MNRRHDFFLLIVAAITIVGIALFAPRYHERQAMRREIKTYSSIPSTSFTSLEDFWRDLERVDSV